jgi:hypothetical protein
MAWSTCHAEGRCWSIAEPMMADFVSSDVVYSELRGFEEADVGLIFAANGREKFKSRHEKKDGKVQSGGYISRAVFAYYLLRLVCLFPTPTLYIPHAILD